MKTIIIPAIWLTYGREDLSQAQKMIDNGFEVEFSRGDIYNKRFELPHDNISFIKGNLVIWKVRDWITADLIDGHYTNHKHHESLDKVLESLIDYKDFELFEAWWFNGGQEIATAKFEKEANEKIKDVIAKMPKILFDNSASDNELETEHNNVFWNEIERLALSAKLHINQLT